MNLANPTPSIALSAPLPTVKGENLNLQTLLAPIEKAINAESWEWLTNNQPQLADAIHSAVVGGAAPDTIYRYMMARLHGGERAGIALRCKQAAIHLGETNRAQR